MKQRGEGTLFDFRALLEKQNRTRLAVVLGGAAMLLLLLSELLPATAACGTIRGVGFPGVSLPGAAGSTAPGPDRADRRGRGHDRDGDTGNRGGDRLCYGHAVGTDPKPGNACAAG